MAAGQPSASPPSTDLHKLTRQQVWDHHPTKSGAAVSNVPPSLANYELPTDECPRCFQGGLIRQLSPKKTPKRGGRQYQIVSTICRPLLDFRLTIRQCETGQHLFRFPLIRNMPRMNDRHSSSASHAASSDESGEESPHDRQKAQPSKPSICIVEGCKKLARARGCATGCCNQHCAEIAVGRELDKAGEGMKTCQKHKDAISLALKDASQRTQTGSKSTASRKSASTSGATAGGPKYSKPYAPSTRGDGSDLFEEGITNKAQHRREIEAQKRSRAQHDASAPKHQLSVKVLRTRVCLIHYIQDRISPER
jgi:hypothetical protein